MKKLQGKKTFIVSILAAAISLIEFTESGNYGIEGFRSLFNDILLPLLATTLRLGIGKK